MLQKRITKPIENISNRKLSIQFSLDGFSFCISNFENTAYHFASYLFSEPNLSPESLLRKIEEVFQEDRDLQDDFVEVIVIHENNLCSFVPNAYFQESALKSYLNYNIKTISTDFIAYDDLDDLAMKNVYIPYVNINNFLFQNFGEFEYKHHATVLLEKLTSLTSKNPLSFYVNVSQKSFDIVVLEDQKLLLFNSFEFQTKEDFIYYILFVYEQLKLDPKETTLYLLGMINTSSDLYKIAYHYIQNIEFVFGSSLILEDESIENHSHFILLG